MSRGDVIVVPGSDNLASLTKGMAGRHIHRRRRGFCVLAPGAAASSPHRGNRHEIPTACATPVGLGMARSRHGLAPGSYMCEWEFRHAAVPLALPVCCSVDVQRLNTGLVGGRSRRYFAIFVFVFYVEMIGSSDDFSCDSRRLYSRSISQFSPHRMGGAYINCSIYLPHTKVEDLGL